MADPVTRQIGNMSVKFVGDNASNNVAMFDSLMANSPIFRSTMLHTAIEFGKINDPPETTIYIGSTIDDLKSVPNFDASNFTRRVDPDHPGYGNFIDQNSWAIVLGSRPANLSLNGKTYPSSLELQMAHELLHPLQRIKDLQQLGAPGNYSEKTVQNQEQDIAQELGYRIGIDFPDVQAADHGYDVAPSRSLNTPQTFGPPTSPPLPLPPPTSMPSAPLTPPIFGSPPLLPPGGSGTLLARATS
jgi:hypothetical protein